ncbi:hypothetical protein AOQ84DRAFT_379273 [Glonium stellatum]|uniref:Uncharacterized protein n=1 Tax=Glonium stellatum TaxID=574774 RepID=A0A8E2EVQ6_9PEZI|nr:hypothetical protein AOQ84DRAFT_379273 [Glonium stellatum]
MAGAKLPTGVVQLSLFSGPYIRILCRSQKLYCTSSFVSSRASPFTIRKPAIDSCALNKHTFGHTGCYRVSPNAWRCLSSSSLRCLAAEKAEVRRDEGGKVEKITSQPVSSSKPRLSPKALRANIASKLSALPHENIYTLPNILTFSRLLAAPAIGYLVFQNQHAWAVGLFAYAGITDLVDGWIARKWNQQTVVGSVIDPMADKTLMTILVGCLAVNGTLPLPLATLIFGRDISLATAAIYYRYASLPSPKTLARYWDFSLPSAEVHPTTISKLNTFLQLGLIGATLTLPLLVPDAGAVAVGGLAGAVREGLGGPEGVQTVVRGLQGVVAATTVWSGLSYVWAKDAVRILGTDETLKRKQGHRGRMVVAGSFGVVLAITAWLGWRDWMREKERDENEGS